jgi:hypothetical protein
MLGWLSVGAERVDGLGEGWTEGVRSTTWARGLAVFPSRVESAWGRSDRFLFPNSSFPRGPEESVPVACGACEGGAPTPRALSTLVGGWNGGWAPGEDHKQALRECEDSLGHFETATCLSYFLTSFHDPWTLPRDRRLSDNQ